MSISLKQLTQDLVTARKENSSLRVSTLRLLISALRNREIDLRGKGKSLTEDDITQVISQQVKQRKDSIASYEEGGREDLVKAEEAELTILEEYTPEQLSSEELKDLVTQAIQETGATTKSEMGKVMGAVMPQIKGRADGKVVGKLVKELLGKDKLRFSFSLISDDKMQELNKKHRGKDYPTDVLSFEINETLPDGSFLSGDILVSKTQAEKQAREQGHSFEKEVAELVAHGALHLLGVHHDEDI